MMMLPAPYFFFKITNHSHYFEYFRSEPRADGEGGDGGWDTMLSSATTLHRDSRVPSLSRIH